MRPESGFSTEANRITREETGRSNMVNLRFRQWQDSGDVAVSLEGFVAWIPKPSSPGTGTLAVTIDMSPVSIVRDNGPVLLTYEMWQSGDRPTGREGVHFEATCNKRDPEAPSHRRISNGGAGLG
jgi:hypothetical protein